VPSSPSPHSLTAAPTPPADSLGGNWGAFSRPLSTIQANKLCICCFWLHRARSFCHRYCNLSFSLPSARSTDRRSLLSCLAPGNLYVAGFLITFLYAQLSCPTSCLVLYCPVCSSYKEQPPVNRPGERICKYTLSDRCSVQGSIIIFFMNIPL